MSWFTESNALEKSKYTTSVFIVLQLLSEQTTLSVKLIILGVHDFWLINPCYRSAKRCDALLNSSNIINISKIFTIRHVKDTGL